MTTSSSSPGGDDELVEQTAELGRRLEVGHVALAGLAQSVMHGLSVRANLGAAREDLPATARLTLELVDQGHSPDPHRHPE